MTHLFHYQYSSVLIQHLIDGCHFAHFHHGLNDFLHLNCQTAGEFAYRDGFTQFNHTLNWRGWLVKALLQAFTGFLVWFLATT